MKKTTKESPGRCEVCENMISPCWTAPITKTPFGVAHVSCLEAAEKIIAASETKLRAVRLMLAEVRS